jgi:hypothetical protein
MTAVETYNVAAVAAGLPTMKVVAETVATEKNRNGPAKRGPAVDGTVIATLQASLREWFMQRESEAGTKYSKTEILSSLKSGMGLSDDEMKIMNEYWGKVFDKITDIAKREGNGRSTRFFHVSSEVVPV